MLSLRELIGEFNLRVLAGEDALDLPVRAVHVSELTDPTPWLSGGEVLMSTGILLDSAECQVEFIERLADRQIAGFGFGIGFTHSEVPPALIEAAGRRGLPVFEVPFELPFIAITESGFARLANEHYATLRRVLQAQERLERVVLSERGLESLVATLAALIGSSVMVFDGRGEQIITHNLSKQLSQTECEAVSVAVLDHIQRREVQPFMPAIEDPSRALAVPVIADGAASASGRTPDAWLIAIKPDASLSEFERLALRQASTIIALELLRERVAGDTERRLAGDVLAGLLAGELTGGDLQRRLEPFGIRDRVSALVMVQPNGGTTAAQAEKMMLGALRSEATPGLVTSDGKLVSALIPGLDEPVLFGLAERLIGRIAQEIPHEPMVVGVGRPVQTIDARRAYHEARCTLEALTLGEEPHGGPTTATGPGGPRTATAGATATGPGGSRGATATATPIAPPRVATYRDLGSFQLLLSLQDDEALKLYCDSVLGPIESSEGYYGGELMRSLEAFIEENGQWERAAKRLYCHRHTLRYRIKRVEELTGRDLSSARDRIEFWLALRGRELFT